MDIEPWQFAATVIGTGGATSVATAVFNWLGQRSKDRTIAQSAVEQAARKLMESAMASANAQMERLEAEVKTLRQEVHELRAAHDRCQEETAELRRDRDELKAQIGRLMAEEPAPAYSKIRRPRSV